ncbi:B-type cyclin [Elasticomyces elasticus]|nr:B-type cyclin [Elasticomyces elasticus]
MDAKPQRPGRTFRVRDENAIQPNGLGGKTLHQRNKSTPTLSSLMQIGGLKNGSKRTAFADVSNTVRNAQSTKDDSSLPPKSKDALLQIQEFVKPAALLRPAQRPLSLAGAKAAMSSTTTTIPTKQEVSEVVSIAQPQTTLTRKVTVKKSTMVLKDNIIAEPLLTANTSAAIRTTALVAPVHQTLVPARQRSHSIAPQDVNSSDTVETCDAVTRQDSVIPSCEESSVSTIQPEPIYMPIEQAMHMQLPGSYSALPTPQADHEYMQKIELQKAHAIKQARQEAVLAYPHPLPTPPEAAGYYEDEEDEEYYYEEGYTTARSLRTGDGTTQGMTIVLAPRYTTKIQREISAAKAFVENLKTPEDIEDETWDTSMVAEYGDEIFTYMRSLEERMRPNPHYMDNQAEIQWSMRSVLMDWLVQVHQRFTLLPETLFLAVNYVDRFLSCKVVSLGKLQLVGATAIFVAAKYEEVNCPSVSEIVYMVDNGYTIEEILKAERFMLSMLQFELGWPGPMSFLRRISKADDYDLETRTLAKYFLEITVMDERFVGCAPSFTAAGAHCLARLMLRKGDWTPAHVFYANYTYSQLRQLLCVILECCDDPQKHHAAVFEKYQDKRYKRASLFVESEIKKGFQLPSVVLRSSFGFRDDSQSWKRK